MAKQAAPSPQKSSMAFWKEKAASSLSASGRASASSGRTDAEKVPGAVEEQLAVHADFLHALVAHALAEQAGRPFPPQGEGFHAVHRSSSATRFCSAFSLSRISVTAAKVFFKASSVKGLST